MVFCGEVVVILWCKRGFWMVPFRRQKNVTSWKYFCGKGQALGSSSGGGGGAAGRIWTRGGGGVGGGFVAPGKREGRGVGRPSRSRRRRSVSRCSARRSRG